LNELPE
jgi:hypothetical protein